MNDTCFDLALGNEVFISDSLVDAALQEIDILFNTEHAEVLGYTDYGTNFEQFLWSLTPDVNRVKSYITGKLADTVYVSQFNYTVDVYENGIPNSQQELENIVPDSAFDSTYIVIIDLYGDTQQLKRKRGTMKVIMF